MKRAEIEAWAIRQLLRIEQKRVIEDSTVELKSGLQDPAKSARRLAGHANAARGESILWLVGVDEKRHEIVGVNPNEIDGWFKQVAAYFEGRVVPDLVDIALDHGGKTVVALKFETDRAPFVVRDGKGERLEVPWREQTEPRSATRSELLGLLEPAHRLPQFEEIRLLLTQKIPDDSSSLEEWGLHGQVYVLAPSSERLLLPLHRCVAIVRIVLDRKEFGFDFSNLGLTPRDASSRDGNPHAIINQAGLIDIMASANLRQCAETAAALGRPAHITLSIGTNLRHQVPPIRLDLRAADTDERATNFRRWTTPGFDARGRR